MDDDDELRHEMVRVAKELEAKEGIRYKTEDVYRIVSERNPKWTLEYIAGRLNYWAQTEWSP
jgi:transposase